MVPSHRGKVAFTGDIWNYLRFTYIALIPEILLLATVESTNFRNNSNVVKMYSPLFSESPRSIRSCPKMIMSLSIRSRLQEGPRLKNKKERKV